MQLQCNTSIYPKSAILKAAYTYTDRAYIFLEPYADGITVSIEAKPTAPSVDVNEFRNELLSQVLRQEIVMQTADIRKLILGRALASTMVEDISRDNPNFAALIDLDYPLEELLDPKRASSN